MTASSRVAVVTGGAQGIGEAIVRALAEDGLTVVLGDRNVELADKVADGFRNDGLEVHARAVDVTDRAQVDELVEATVADHGRLDVLVNNVGWTEITPFIEEDDAYWDRIVAVNFLGTVYACHAAAKVMIDRGDGGRLINIGSDAARVGQTGETVYAGAKAAVLGFTKSLARELARHRILVNCVCPGPTDTPLNRSLSDRMMAAILKSSPLGRLAEPAEVAAGVAFFASPKASFVTGQVLSMSGGLTMCD